MNSSESDLLEVDQSFAWLGALLDSKRAALRRRLIASFAVIEHGRYTLDTGAREMITRGASGDAELSVVANRRALSDLARGTLDPGSPRPGQLFLYSGPAERWRELALAMRGGLSLVGIRVHGAAEGAGR